MRTCRYIAKVSKIKCKLLAEWQIYWGSDSDLDCTESCTKHVGETLAGGVENRIYPINQDPLDAAISEAESDLRITVPEMFYGKPIFYKDRD